MFLLAGALTASLWLILCLCGLASAQQFNNARQQFEYGMISDTCYRALNTTMDCPIVLASVASETPKELSLAQTELICTSSCFKSLLEVQKAAKENCTADVDVTWDRQKVVASPATWIIDKLVYAYNATCVTDSMSGNLCASVLQNESDTDSQSRDCSPCALDLIHAKLESPLHYSDEDANNFLLSASSCGATEYAVTSPPPLTVNIQHPARVLWDAYQAMPTPAWAFEHCKGIYKVIPHDTYRSIAAKYGASMFWLRNNEYNPNVGFDEVFEAGTTLCFPPGRCELYTVKENETCEEVIDKITPELDMTQLEDWNPGFNEACANPEQLNGSTICIAAPPEPHRRPTTTPKPTATGFTGCEDEWSTSWPGKPYNSCGCPRAPCPYYPFGTPTASPITINFDQWKACTSGRGTPLTEGECASTASWPVKTATSRRLSPAKELEAKYASHGT